MFNRRCIRRAVLTQGRKGETDLDRYRLKNVIIFILLFVNLFLLSSLAYRSVQARASRERAMEQLSALFEADGIALDPAIIPSQTPPSGRTLVRDSALERAAAAYLLGGGMIRSDRGGISLYAGSNGAAQFRDSGGFNAAGTLAASNGEAFCQAFCEKFLYEIVSSRLDNGGSGTITALRKYGGLTVCNCAVSFTLDQGAVTSVSGTLLPDGFDEAAGAEPLSAPAALTAFQSMRRETGAVASSITDIYLCYILQSSTAVPMSLAPAWCIVTDTVPYYVNCHTGAVSQY